MAKNTEKSDAGRAPCQATRDDKPAPSAYLKRDSPPANGAAAILNDVKRLWRGEIGLWSAFWGWLILGGILVNGMTTALNLVLVTRDLPVTGLVVGYAISVPYNLLAMIGVWRASEVFNGDPGVAKGVRWLTVIIAVVLCVT